LGAEAAGVLPAGAIVAAAGWDPEFVAVTAVP